MKKLIILVFALALASTAFAQNKQTANYSGIVEKEKSPVPSQVTAARRKTAAKRAARKAAGRPRKAKTAKAA